MQAIDAFRAELEAAGLRPPEIIADGKLHRVPVDGKPGSRDGAYVLHPDDPPAGWWQNWRTGQDGTWTAGGNGRASSPQERQALAQRLEATRRQREEAQAQAWAGAAQRARTVLDQAQPCQEHAYLQRKCVQLCAGLKVDQEGRLLVPVLGPDGKPQSVQTITADGSKLFMAGGKMAGGYFSIKGDAGPLVVCEGLATGLSLHEATGHTVLVAFNAGNLEAVARMAREKYPERSIILAGDDDHATPGNPGLTKATAAALAVGGMLAIPVFAQAGGGTDFNDLHQAEGLEAVKAQVEAAQAPEPTQAEEPQAGTPLPGPPPDWPFQLRADGVYRRYETENGSTGETAVEWRWICSRLEVLAETRDVQGRSWGRLLTVHTREGQINEWAMPMELMAGDGQAYRAELLSLGLEIAPGNAARQALHEYISTARPPERARNVDRIGWHGAAYVLPDATFGETAGERVLYQAATTGDHPFRVAGTLDDWQAHLARLCVGNSRLAFAVSAAFAAPLLHLAGLEGGGFHLRGASSLGKTTALLVAGSVWGGGGVSGFLRSWRATSNGLEGVAAAHSDALLCLDEMGQVDGREAGETAYMLANGQGKSRARRDGSGRPPATWRVLFLSTGELSLADKMNEAGRKAKAGQEVRLVDLPADSGAGLGLFENLHGFDSAQCLADHLRRAASAYYGTPARAFLERITADLDELGRAVNVAVQGFVAEHCPAGADGQVSRAATRFGLAAAAGELAGTVGVLPWPDGEAERAAANCFQAWLDQRGGTGPAEVRAGLEQVRRFFQAHGASRFEPWQGADKERPITNRAGFIRHGDEGRELFIFPETFRAEVAAGFDAKALVKELVALGLLLPAPDGKPASPHRVPALGRPVRLYRFSPAVLGEE